LAVDTPYLNKEMSKKCSASGCFLLPASGFLFPVSGFRLPASGFRLPNDLAGVIYQSL
jgi:hypothetical protein